MLLEPKNEWPPRHRARGLLVLIALVAMAASFIPPAIAQVPPLAQSIMLEANYGMGGTIFARYDPASLPLASPVEASGFHISLPFGWQENVSDGGRMFYHYGIDISNYSSGDEVRSTIDGRVVESGFRERSGNYVIVENGDIQTFYGDLLTNGAPIGSMVKTGDIIGLIGSSGPRSTEPHLQYAVRVKGSWVDPLPILEAGGATFGSK